MAKIGPRQCRERYVKPFCFAAVRSGRSCSIANPCQGAGGNPGRTATAGASAPVRPARKRWTELGKGTGRKRRDRLPCGAKHLADEVPWDVHAKTLLGWKARVNTGARRTGVTHCRSEAVAAGENRSPSAAAGCNASAGRPSEGSERSGRKQWSCFTKVGMWKQN